MKADLLRCNQIAEKLTNYQERIKNLHDMRLNFNYKGFNCCLEPNKDKIEFTVYMPEKICYAAEELWKTGTRKISFTATKDISKILNDINNRITWDIIEQSFAMQEKHLKHWEDQKQKHLAFRKQVLEMFQNGKMYKDSDYSCEIYNDKVTAIISGESMEVRIKDCSLGELYNVVLGT